MGFALCYEPDLDPPDYLECEDCGVYTEIHLIKILDDRPLCPFCFEQYNTEL